MRNFLPGDEGPALISRYEAVQSRLHKAAIASSRNIAEITLVAISKFHSAEAVATLACHWGKEGVPIFGENYVQEALEKQDAILRLAPDVHTKWHFTGHLQSRKAKDVLGRFSCVQTVDSLKLAQNLQKNWQKLAETQQMSPLPILLQVNIGREEQKSGVLPEDALKLAVTICSLPELEIHGLMCIPPLDTFDDDDGEASRPYFAAMRELRDRLAQETGLPLQVLSMGMSHDCAAAISEGATMVRIGSDIFGPRPARQGR